MNGSASLIACDSEEVKAIASSVEAIVIDRRIPFSLLWRDLRTRTVYSPMESHEGKLESLRVDKYYSSASVFHFISKFECHRRMREERVDVFTSPVSSLINNSHSPDLVPALASSLHVDWRIF